MYQIKMVLEHCISNSQWLAHAILLRTPTRNDSFKKCQCKNEVQPTCLCSCYAMPTSLWPVALVCCTFSSLPSSPLATLVTERSPGFHNISTLSMRIKTMLYIVTLQKYVYSVFLRRRWHIPWQHAVYDHLQSHNSTVPKCFMMGGSGGENTIPHTLLYQLPSLSVYVTSQGVGEWQRKEMWLVSCSAIASATVKF